MNIASKNPGMGSTLPAPDDVHRVTEPIQTQSASEALMDHLSSTLPLFSAPSESLQSEWSDTSPNLADSLLSMDFDSTSTLGTSLYQSEIPSDSSLSPLATPKDAVGSRLFAPIDAVVWPTTDALCHWPDSDALSEPKSKRARLNEPCCLPDSIIKQDFTLFPDDDEQQSRRRVPSSLQTSLVTGDESASVLNLLDSLNSSVCDASPFLSPEPTSTSALSKVFTPNTHTPASLTQTANKSPIPEIAGTEGITSRSSATTLVPASADLADAVKSFRGTHRRRRDTHELLPLDAPVQPRTYHTESATSRRDSKEQSSVSPAEPPLVSDGSSPRPEMDARSMKRLSNTIAARRSRHRKAEELKRLYETIEELESQVQQWKERCNKAEMERDRLRRVEPLV